MSKRIRDKLTTKGGNRGYEMIRSKISKGPDNYGKVVTVEREKMMKKMGKDPGVDVVAMHETFGSHFNNKGDPFHPGTRSENTAESNKHRAVVRKRLMLKK
jgi:hypothetical protein